MSAAARLASHLELADGFTLFVLVCDNREQLDALLEKTLGGPMPKVWVSPGNGPDWPAQLLHRLEVALLEGPGLLVLDATDAHPAEKSGWTHVLRRVNEGRDRLVERWAGPLVLAVPSWLLPVLPAEAPDLWSVRTAVERGDPDALVPRRESAYERIFLRYLTRAMPAISDLFRSPQIADGLRGLSQFMSDPDVAKKRRGLDKAVEDLRPKLAGDGLQAIEAARQQILFARLSPDKSHARLLIDEALSALRRLSTTAHVDLRAQIAQALFNGAMLVPSERAWLDEAEILARSLDAEQPGLWNSLLVTILYMKLVGSSRDEHALDWSTEALARVEQAEHRGETWAKRHMPDALWEHASLLALLRTGQDQARGLRAQAMKRLRALAVQDPEARAELPFWLMRAAQAEVDPSRTLDDLTEALHLWIAEAPRDLRGAGESVDAVLESSKLPPEIRSQAVRVLRGLQTLTGPEHPMFGLFADAIRRLDERV